MNILENETHVRYPAWRDIPRYLWSIAVSQKRQADLVDRLEAIRLKEDDAERPDLYRRDGKRFVKFDADMRRIAEKHGIVRTGNKKQ